MKKFKEFLENYDVYLDMPNKPKEKKYKANVIVTDQEGNNHTFSISSDDNIRTEAHKTVKELTGTGFKLKDVDYEM